MTKKIIDNMLIDLIESACDKSEIKTDAEKIIEDMLSNLIKMSENQNEDMFPCDGCQKTFPYKKTLKNHKSEFHSNEKQIEKICK